MNAFPAHNSRRAVESTYSPPSRPVEDSLSRMPYARQPVGSSQPRIPASDHSRRWVEESYYLPQSPSFSALPRMPVTDYSRDSVEETYLPTSSTYSETHFSQPSIESTHSPYYASPTDPSLLEEHAPVMIHQMPRTPSISEGHYYASPTDPSHLEAHSPVVIHQMPRTPSISEGHYYASPTYPSFLEVDPPVVIQQMPRTPSTSKAHYSHRGPIEPTMIQGDNVSIGYANLNMTNQVINPPSKLNALDLLRSYSSPAALLDANERYNPPRCIDGTRRTVMRKLEDWIRHDRRHVPLSSIFWLYGGVGAGKSALSQTLAEKVKRSGNLAATFFFGAAVNRNDGNRLIPTLTLQLVQTFKEVTPFVEENIVQNPDLFEKSRRTQMLDLLIDPLRRLSVEENSVRDTALKPHPRLIVIDGLDECSDRDIQCDLLRIIDNAIPQFPYPLRFLITSRPESCITRTFKHDLRSKVVRYNLSEDADANEDIRVFLNGKFAKIRNTHPLRRHLPPQWPTRTSVNSIVERSSGHFIYASTVIRFIESPQHRPDDRLLVILGLKQAYGKDKPYARLDSLYRLIFLEIRDPNHLEKIHIALGIMYLRSLKSGLFALPQWTSDRHAIETLLEFRPGDLILLFDPLLSLVTFEKDNIRILHKSLFDYLLDSSRSEDLQLNLGLAHGTATYFILKHENLHDNWHSEHFRDFAYHCQFTHLNNVLKDYLRSLASNKPVLRLHMSSEQSCLLESILYFLQVISRQDFDPSGRTYRNYVKMKSQCLKSVVPWSQRLKCIIPMLTRLEVIQKSSYFKRSLRSSFGLLHFDFKRAQLRDTNGFGRSPIPPVNATVIDSIKQEHQMFSSYVKAHHRYPDVVVSFLESSAGLFHSCHIAIRAVSTVWMTFVMLVTYTNLGVRLSCSEFENLLWPDYLFLENTKSLVDEHLRRTEQEVNNSYTVTKTYFSWSGASQY